MKLKRKRNNKKDEEFVNAILGAAILGAATEQKDEAQEALENAEKLHKQYEAFIEVGFTEEQATAFVAAILS